MPFITLLWWSPWKRVWLIPFTGCYFRESSPPKLGWSSCNVLRMAEALPLQNPWIYYILPLNANSMSPTSVGSSARLLLVGTGADSIPEGLEEQAIQQSNKQKTTYALLQKVWNKSKQLQSVTGYIAYTPFWGNHTYAELAKIQQGLRWRAWGITLLFQVFHCERLLPFTDLHRRFTLLDSMFY